MMIKKNIFELRKDLKLNDFESVINTIQNIESIIDIKDFEELSKYEKEFKEIIFCLMNNSSFVEIESFLYKLVHLDNDYLKEIIFNCPNVYPIPKIVQNEWFKDEIVKYTNSEYYKKKYKKERQLRIESGDEFYILRAFLTQYHNSFNFNEFDVELKKGMSNYQIAKKVKKMRIDSIRLLDDGQMKVDLCYLYFTQFLNILYKTRFMKLVKQEFPDLEFPWYENYLQYRKH